MIASPRLTAIGFGFAASVLTYLGGTAVFRLRGRLSLILALVAGIVTGVALFDLIPEALAIGSTDYGEQPLFAMVALGMMTYLVIDQGLGALSRNRSLSRHQLGPASLTLHSLIDGLGIGLGFHVSSTAGVLIASGVVAHDLADGINTVGLGLMGNDARVARRWLVANSLAPTIGVLLATGIRLGDHALAPLLALFGGGFLYIGACQLIPRTLVANPRPSSAVAIVAGMAFIYAALSFARR